MITSFRTVVEAPEPHDSSHIVCYLKFLLLIYVVVSKFYIPVETELPDFNDGLFGLEPGQVVAQTSGFGDHRRLVDLLRLPVQLADRLPVQFTDFVVEKFLVGGGHFGQTAAGVGGRGVVVDDGDHLSARESNPCRSFQV